MKLSLRDLDLSGKSVLVRVDFNVPLDGDGNITDDTRIQGALPTIRHLLDGGARVILMSHLGRPKGERNLKFSLQPVADRLGEIFPGKVSFASDCVGDEAMEKATNLGAGSILLLENLRFHKGETENDSAFAAQLGELAELYVNDAFGTAHRAHASTAGVAEHMEKRAMGFLLERELEVLVGELEEPKRPFVVIMGGAKVSDKIKVITALLDKADTILVGGAMAYTFRLAQGHAVGNSLVEPDYCELALQILKDAEAKGVKFLLPLDQRECEEFSDTAETWDTASYDEGGGITEGREGIDIGPLTEKLFASEIAGAGTIIWNGPMGVFEKAPFAKGTISVSQAIADSPAYTIIGGGDSVTAVNKFDLGDKMDFLSTGGGATLELLEGAELPGVAALSDSA